MENVLAWGKYTLGYPRAIQRRICSSVSHSSKKGLAIVGTHKQRNKSADTHIKGAKCNEILTRRESG